MDNKQNIQEVEYEFPYHYLTTSKPYFSLSKNLWWGHIYQSYVDFVLKEIQQHNVSSIIDIGCGDGRFVRELSLLNKIIKIVGVDCSDQAISLARAFNPHIDFRVEDVSSDYVHDNYDAAVSIEVLEHIKPEDTKLFAKNIATRLKKGGVLFLTTPTENLKLAKKHYQHFTEDKIQAVFSEYFTIEKVFFLNKENFFSKILNRILINRFFTLNNKTIVDFVYQTYIKYFLLATKNTGTRIFLVMKLK